MSRLKYALVALALMSSVSTAFAASFDCTKAKRPLEKFICSSPQLDSADEQLGQAFKEVNATFPLKGFVMTTQRSFLSEYPSCMMDRTGKSVANPMTEGACLKMIQTRINELRQYGKAKVYSDAAGKFTQENIAILVYPKDGKSFIQFWGNWMPDAYQPAPFPAGHFCNIEDRLMPAQGGFKTGSTDDSIITITEGSVKLSAWIMCSPRTGISEGIYKRVN